MIKLFLLISFIFSYSSSALAEARLLLLDENNSLEIKADADANKIAVFEKNNSLWFISEDIEPITLKIPSDVRKKYAIKVVEALKVNGGSGVRVQFKNKPKYQLNIIDKAAKEHPISVISLKEGLVLSGGAKSKILMASSPLLGESVSVITSGDSNGQIMEKNRDGSTSLATKIGYAFISKDGVALKSLYKDRQQFMSNNVGVLVKMAKNFSKKKSVLSTKRKPIEVKKVTLKTSEKPVDIEGKNDSEDLRIPQFALIQPMEKLDDVVALAIPEVEVVNQNPFVKDEDAFTRALAKISAARDKMEAVKTPVKGTTEASYTPIEEVPDVLDEEGATAIASDVLAGTGTFDTGKVDNAFGSLGELENDDYDDFEIPDLDPDEPIFQVYGDGTYKIYQDYQHKILAALAAAPSQIRRQQFRLRLAKLYMSYERPYEVLMTMANMPKYENSEQIRDTSARILSGAANLVSNRPEDAMFFLEKESKNFEKDRKLWLALAYELTDKDKEALELFPKYIDQSENYPKYLKKELYMSYGRLLLRQERLSELKELMQSLTSKLKQPQLPPEAIMLLARANVIERNDDLVETLLAQAAASDDLEVSFLAQYEFLSFLLNRGDLGVKQAVSHLENLRFLWRGGYVEQEILVKLGHMYVAKGEQRKGLERLKYHNIYFPKSKLIPDITEVMTSAFTDLYLDETAGSELDPLALLGLYYDFRELTPSGDKGDLLIAQIGERLRRLGLFDRAISVLEHQLKFRVKDEQLKGEMGHNLAKLYYLNQNYKDSLMALNRTESSKLSDEVHENRQYIEAESYIGLKKYNKALVILNRIKGDNSSKLKAKIAWIQNKYTDVVTNYESIYDKGENLPYKWGEDEKVNFVQLAVAYNNLGATRDLESLKKRYQKQLDKDDNINKIINFLLKDQGSDLVSRPDDKKELWTRLTYALDTYHEFADFYDGFVEDREGDRRNKDIFNRRMRQMSAPARF